VNLVEALLKENESNREFLAQLDESDEVIGKNPGTEISRTIYKDLIKRTDEAIGSGDVVEMVKMAQLHGVGKE